MKQYVILICISIIAQVIFADPFYKTMPQEVEIVYDELKKIEEKAINSFKKKYLKIPIDQWNQLYLVKEQLQMWLINDASTNIHLQEPVMPTSSCKQAYEEYCHQYIAYECARQELNFNKIQLKFATYNSLVVATLRDLTVHFTLYEFKGTYLPNFSLDYNTLPTIQVDIIKLMTQKNYFKRLVLKHELVHLTEGHSLIRCIVEQLVEVYYGSEEIKSDAFLLLYNNLHKTQELIADILPALLSPEYASEYFRGITPNMLKDDIHPSSKTLMIWLKKIELLNIERSANNQIFFKWLKKMWYKYVTINMKYVQFHIFS